METVPTPLHFHPYADGFRKLGRNSYALVDIDGNTIEVVEEWEMNDIIDEDDADCVFHDGRPAAAI